MKPCVTVSLVPEARGGPFIFWDNLEEACRKAADLGYAAIEVFPAEVDALDRESLKRSLEAHNLQLATIGTGGGWVRHKLTLTSADPAIREKARGFIATIIEVASGFGAAVIIGSMQGKADAQVSRMEALAYLFESLNELSAIARRKNVTILYEHLNRYETNLLNRVEEVMPFLENMPQNVKILADLFHMSIEEASIPAAIRLGASRIGHVHLADSNRRPAGLGHTDFNPIFAALREINYDGYVSAEAFPYPSPDEAAAQTMKAFRKFSAASIL